MRGRKRGIPEFLERIKIVGNSGCWEWTGSRIKQGYGTLQVEGKPILAHRYSFLQFKGSIGDLYVLHKCDNRICVNPEHLFLGTHEDNMLDMARKGRVANKKATPDQVREIRALHRIVSIKEIANRYQLGLNTIKDIVHRRSWKHVE